MPSFRGLQKEKEACQTQLHAHHSAISCLWATLGEKVLVFAWHSEDLVSLPTPSKETSFIPNVEGNQVEKNTLKPSGICKNLFMDWKPA